VHLPSAPTPDDGTLQGAMYRPLVLASNFEEEPRGNWYRPFDAQAKQAPGATLQFNGKLDDPSTWLEPAGEKLAFRPIAQDKSVPFVPLSRIVHERYAVYNQIHEDAS